MVRTPRPMASSASLGRLANEIGGDQSGGTRTPPVSEHNFVRLLRGVQDRGDAYGLFAATVAISFCADDFCIPGGGAAAPCSAGPLVGALRAYGSIVSPGN